VAKMGFFARCYVGRVDGLREMGPQALQLLREVVSRGITLLRVLRETALDDPAEKRRSLGRAWSRALAHPG